MGVKELAQAEGFPNTHASVVYRDEIASHDCPEVARLRAAGAVVTGLTTAPEFGIPSYTATPLHGVTRNPWRMMRDLGKGRALSQLLADMELDGMVKREVRGRRTFSVSLVDDWDLVPPQELVPDATKPSGDDGTDYDQLAHALLAVTLKRASAPPSPDPARLKRAEEALATNERQLLEVSHDRDELEAKGAELEEQVRILTHNQGVLQSQIDRKPVKDGPTIEERLSDAERRMLKELQSALPETPQSKMREKR